MNTRLWIAAGCLMAGLIGLNAWHARHPVWVSPHAGLVSAAVGRLDECEAKISAALPGETFIHALEGTSEKDDGVRAERHLLLRPDSTELRRRLHEACAPLRTGGRLRTEIEIENDRDGCILKMVVSSRA